MRASSLRRGTMLIAMMMVGCFDSESSAAGSDAGGQHADSAVPDEDGGSPVPDASAEDAAVQDAGAVAIPSIQLQRQGGLGFCIESGELMSAAIEAAGPTMPATLRASVFRSWPANCSGRPDCAELESRERTLSDAQRRELSAAIAALPPTGCESANTFVCDPCLISQFSVDGKTYVFDGGCTGGCIAVHRLGALLDRLTSDPPPVDPADCYSPSANLDRVRQTGAVGCTCENPEQVACVQDLVLQCVRLSGSGWGRWGEIDSTPCRAESGGDGE